MEQIVGQQYNKSRRRMEYLVRWKGYGPEYDTFEPEAGLRNAFSKLREYKMELNDATEKDARAGSTSLPTLP